MPEPPLHAASVWLEGDTISIHFPGSTGHAVRVSNDAYGIQCLLQVLREREDAGATRVGERGCLTQAQLDSTRIKLSGFTGPARNAADRDALREADDREKRKMKIRKNAEDLITELGL